MIKKMKKKSSILELVPEPQPCYDFTTVAKRVLIQKKIKSNP